MVCSFPVVGAKVSALKVPTSPIEQLGSIFTGYFGMRNYSNWPIYWAVFSAVLEIFVLCRRVVILYCSSLTHLPLGIFESGKKNPLNLTIRNIFPL